MGRVGRVGKPDGDRVGGRYRLVERLGSGGMSVVWHGYDEILGRHVAVKVLSPQLAGDLTFRERLRQEALAAARLCHPNITGIYDFGESVRSDGVTVPYVVMELNDGESVAARVNRQGPLPWAAAVTVAAEVASALATAHARGVVHRDVTPANVMLTGAGAKVVDFGISALVGDRDTAPDGSLLGTPAYLAPERLNGGQVSPATDVYALGLVLYRALTGRLPWPAETTTEALRAHLYADPEPIPTLPGLPADIADLCLRCLAKQPDDRPCAADLAHAFAAAVGLHAVIPPAPATDACDAELADPAWPTVQLPATAAASAARRPAPFPGRRVAGPARALASLPIRATAARRTDGRGGAPASPTDLARSLWLRAGLRVSAALRIGGPRPLGGGLFVGGRLGLAARLPSAERLGVTGSLGSVPFAAGHRVQAGVATLTVLAIVGLAWAAAQEPAQVGPAQAAAAGGAPAVGVARTAVCKVRYQVRRDSGSTFDAALTVTNIGDRALSGWQLKFAFPGSQRLAGTPATITQRGRLVVVHPGKAATLQPGRSADVALRGSYRTTNPLPLAFALNGRACQVEVLGGTTVATDQDDPGGEAAGDAVDGSSGGTHTRKASRSGESVSGVPGSGSSASGSGSGDPGSTRGHAGSGRTPAGATPEAAT